MAFDQASVSGRRAYRTAEATLNVQFTEDLSGMTLLPAGRRGRPDRRRHGDLQRRANCLVRRQHRLSRRQRPRSTRSRRSTPPTTTAPAAGHRHLFGGRLLQPARRPATHRPGPEPDGNADRRRRGVTIETGSAAQHPTISGDWRGQPRRRSRLRQCRQRPQHRHHARRPDRHRRRRRRRRRTVGTLTISDVDLSGSGKAIDIDEGGALNVTIDSLGSTGSARQGVDLQGGERLVHRQRRRHQRRCRHRLQHRRRHALQHLRG